MSFAQNIPASDRPVALVVNPTLIGPPRPRPEGATVAWIVDETLRLHEAAVDRRLGTRTRGWTGADGAPMRLRPASVLLEGDHRPLGAAGRVKFTLASAPAPDTGWLGVVDAGGGDAPRLRVTLLGRFVDRNGTGACPPPPALAGAQTESSRAMAARAQAALASARPDLSGFVEEVVLDRGPSGFAALARAVARTEARVLSSLPPGLCPATRELHAFGDVAPEAHLAITCCAYASQNRASEGADILLRSVVQVKGCDRLLAVAGLRLMRGRAH